MTVLSKLLDNVADISVFGPRFPLRHLALLFGVRRMGVRLPGGRRVQIRTDESDGMMLRQIFRLREYELGVPAITERIRRRHDEIVAAGQRPVIVDAGANIGGSALWFSAEYPDARIVAIEPDPHNAALARTNLEGVANAAVIEAAIGSEEGHFALIDMGLASAQRTERAAEGLPIVTVAGAAATVPNGALFIVKVDIEGFEADLFSSNLDWIGQAFVVIIEPHDWMLPGEHRSRSFQRALAEHDFELLIAGENLVYVRG